MASVIVAIADGFKALLQAASDANTFIRQFTAERGYQEPLPLTDDRLHVDAVLLANEVELEPGTRGQVKYLVPFNVAIRKRLNQSETDSATGSPLQIEIDELMEFAEQIAEFFYHQRIIANGAATIGPGSMTTIAPENKLEEYSQFLAIIRVTFLHYKTP